MKKEEERISHKIDNVYQAYQTFPLAFNDETDSQTNMSLPSEDNVKAAKDWVDFNKK